MYTQDFEVVVYTYASTLYHVVKRFQLSMCLYVMCSTGVSISYRLLCMGVGYGDCTHTYSDIIQDMVATMHM